MLFRASHRKYQRAFLIECSIIIVIMIMMIIMIIIGVVVQNHMFDGKRHFHDIWNGHGGNCKHRISGWQNRLTMGDNYSVIC